jgi:hypothetical protein
MKKLLVAAGTAILTMSFIAVGFAAQGHDPGGSPPTSGSESMGGDRGTLPDTGTGTTDKQNKKKKADESSSNMGQGSTGDSDRGTGAKSKAPPVPAEGSNPSLDKAGKGSASGG